MQDGDSNEDDDEIVDQVEPALLVGSPANDAGSTASTIGFQHEVAATGLCQPCTPPRGFAPAHSTAQPGTPVGNLLRRTWQAVRASMDTPATSDPGQGDPAEDCPICMEPLCNGTVVNWPSCPRHRMHLACCLRQVPMAAGIAHMLHSGDASRLGDAPCPLCRAPWGHSGDAVVAAHRLVGSAADEGMELPRRGCPCGQCHQAGLGPDPSEEALNPYEVVRPAGAPVPHAEVFCSTHWHHRPMNWHVNRRQAGWEGFWQCAICTEVVGASEVPQAAGTGLPCACGNPSTQWTGVRMRGATGGRMDMAWRCLDCSRSPRGTRGPQVPTPRIAATWQALGPPRAPPRGNRNSFFYVPVILHAAGLLSAQAAAEWSQHPASSAWWDQLTARLAAAPDVQAEEFEAAVQLACVGDNQTGSEPPIQRIRAARLNAALRWSFRDAVASSMDTDGYLHAGVQEAILAVFGGEIVIRALPAIERQLRDRRQYQLPPEQGGQEERSACDDVHEGDLGPGPSAPQLDSLNAPAASSGRISHLPDAWADIEHIDLQTEFRTRVRMLRSVPNVIRGDYARIQSQALAHIYRHRAAEPHLQVSAWKLLLLLPRMLLQPVGRGGEAGQRILRQRIVMFDQGQWQSLLNNARQPRRDSRRDLSAAERDAARVRSAMRSIEQGELSHAARTLRSSGLAPGNVETLRELQDPVLRPQVREEPIPPQVLNHVPREVLQLDPAVLATVLQESRRGLSPGQGGTRFEHLKLCLEDEAAMDLLLSACQQIASAGIPAEIVLAMRMSSMTALQKDNGRVRGIAAGDVYRRLVAKTLARMKQETFRRRVAPANFGLAARAGTDSLGHFVRLFTDSSPHATVLAIDGVGAFDHVRRSRMFIELAGDPELAPLLPFLRLWYEDCSTFIWDDDNGVSHTITQADGGEQGDALMPAMFCMAMRPALEDIQRQLHPDDLVVAYLDDVYLLVRDPARARAAYDVTAAAFQRFCGIAVNHAKLAAWNRSGQAAPPGIAELGDDVWRANAVPERCGVTVVGVPIGTDEYVADSGTTSVEAEQTLLTRSAELCGVAILAGVMAHVVLLCRPESKSLAPHSSSPAGAAIRSRPRRKDHAGFERAVGPA